MDYCLVLRDRLGNFLFYKVFDIMTINALSILVSNINIALKTSNEFVIVPYIKLNLRILQVFYRNGFIAAFEVYFDKIFDREMVRVRLTRHEGILFLKSVRLISKPSSPIY